MASTDDRDQRGRTTSGAIDPHPLEDMLRDNLCERLGIRLVSLSADAGVMTMPVEGNTQPAGLLHGGASIALAETVASFCGYVHARELYGDQGKAVGTHVNAVHLRSARSGTVTAHCRAIRLGRSLSTYEVQILDEDENLLATVTVTIMALPPR